MSKRLTAEEKGERQRVVRNASAKTVITALVVGVIVFAIFSSKGFFGFIIGIFAGGAVFGVSLLLGGVAYTASETAQSNRRLADLAEQRRLEEQSAAELERQRIEKERREQAERERIEAERRAQSLAEQKRLDDRQYLMRKLSTTVGYIDIYDPEDPKTCALLRHNISDVLSEILAKHEHSELKKILQREPDVLGMVNEMEEHLRAKGIKNAQAVQIFSARPIA